MKPFRTLAIFLLATGASYAAFTIPWSTLDSGGGTSSGGAFSVTGTIGQFDAHAAGASGGIFTLNGGYWAQVVAMPDDPELAIVKFSNGDVSIQWQSDAIGWQLQTSTTLAAGSWSNVGGVITGPGAFTVMRDPSVPKQFFRLLLP